MSIDRTPTAANLEEARSKGTPVFLLMHCGNQSGQAAETILRSIDELYDGELQFMTVNVQQVIEPELVKTLNTLKATGYPQLFALRGKRVVGKTAPGADHHTLVGLVERVQFWERKTSQSPTQ